MTEKRENLRRGMLILFITGIISLVVTVMGLLATSPLTQWGGVVLTVAELAAIVLLMTARPSGKFKAALVLRVLMVVSNAAVTVWTAKTGTITAGMLALSIAVAVAGAASLCLLYLGAAEVMEEEGRPDVAASGKTAFKLTVAMYVLAIVSLVGGVATAAVSGAAVSYGFYVGGVLAGSILLLLLGFATAVVAIAAIVSRLTFFWKCYQGLA